MESRLRLYLDDERVTPEGWERAYTAREAIAMLQGDATVYGVTHVSLDHDLGPPENGTGYDVLLWIEKETHTQANYLPPKITVHSANPSAKEKMLRGVESINRKVREKVDEFFSS
jgi:hypothetical protein